MGVADGPYIRPTRQSVAGCGAYNICLFGAAPDTDNMGVSALCVSLIKGFLEITPNANISLLIGNKSHKTQEIEVLGRKYLINILNYRLSPRSRLQEHVLWIFMLACLQRLSPFRSMRKKIIDCNAWLKALDRADFVGDIRGGDSFSDIYGLKRLILGSLPAVISLLLKKHLILLLKPTAHLDPSWRNQLRVSSSPDHLELFREIGKVSR